MRKLVLLLLLAIGAAHTATYAQSPKSKKYDDVVYLENGSVIRGTLLEQTASVVKLKTYDGNIFVWDMPSVDSLVREPTIYKTRRNLLMPARYRGKFSPSRSGYIGIVESYFGVGSDAGILTGRFDGSSYRPYYQFGGLAAGFNIINGYRFGHHFAMGVGIGFRAYSYSSGGDDLRREWDYCLPVFAHFRTNFLKRDLSPYAAFNIGWNPSLMRYVDRRYMSLFVEPSVGLDLRISDRNSLLLSLGFTMLFPRDYDPFSDTYGTVMMYRANFTLGVSF